MIGDSDELLLYDHTKRSVVGTRLKIDGSVTALASDKVSGLIAVGTSNGDLLLMKLTTSGEAPRLELVRRTSTVPEKSYIAIHAVFFLDDGKRLISSASMDNGVFAWDTATLTRKRKFPTTLTAVRWASYTAGEPWLVIAGTESTKGKIELIDPEERRAPGAARPTPQPRARCCCLKFVWV